MVDDLEIIVKIRMLLNYNALNELVGFNCKSNKMNLDSKVFDSAAIAATIS
jgi:hypothetical protein